MTKREAIKFEALASELAETGKLETYEKVRTYRRLAYKQNITTGLYL